jgi:hypothetical protein
MNAFSVWSPTGRDAKWWGSEKAIEARLAGRGTLDSHVDELSAVARLLRVCSYLHRRRVNPRQIDPTI